MRRAFFVCVRASHWTQKSVKTFGGILICVNIVVCVCVSERVTEALADGESEEELGAGVKAVFNSFKTQLRAHFTVSTIANCTLFI